MDADSAIPVVYKIDRADRIIDVNEAWQQFARENGAPELATGVIGHSLWDYIANVNVAQLYRDLLTHVRTTGHRVQIPFRCDSPTSRCFLRLELIPLADGVIEFRGVTLRLEPRGSLAGRRADRQAAFAALGKSGKLAVFA